ncbi:MAG: flagellar basal body rod protein FlgB [Gracilibacteraceae bacterium]|jgi:flagellar basal-body rod protein FlgB|nr:flagellar basal body rod protein FlgB [Gracilibacteraceae bacterium]
MNFLDNPSHLVMEKTMDALWQRARVQSENIANAATPGYKRKVVDFEEELQRHVSALSAADSRGDKMLAISELQPRVYEDKTTNVNVDGNNVELDQEFLEMTDTLTQYQYLQRLLSDGMARLRYAITEGRG